MPEQGHRRGEMDPLRSVGSAHPVEAAGHEGPVTASRLLQVGFRHPQARLDRELVGKHFPSLPWRTWQFKSLELTTPEPGFP